MAGEEEGWVATHQDPGQDAARGSGGAGSSSIPTLGDAVDIPDMDDDDDDDIPDMAELEMDDDDEVGHCRLQAASVHGTSQAGEPMQPAGSLP
jgi:hypothetical protein